MLNAIRFLAAQDGQRILPVHFGPMQTVYVDSGGSCRGCLFTALHSVALMLDHEQMGR
jgi:Fe-S cluster biogenesis protein NfuA